MSDCNKRLSELYQRVVQNELGLLATINEDGWVQFKHPDLKFKDPDLGKLYIGFNENRSEYMELICRFFYDPTRAREGLMRICNSVNNRAMVAKLTLSDTSNLVSASVALLLAAPGSIPDEVLVRGVIHYAMLEIMTAIEEFANELQKLDNPPTTSGQLAELYQRVVQDELGLVATIEDGDILFDHPEMGPFFISLDAERDPECMRLVFPAFFDATRGVAREELVRICNRVNVRAKLVTLTVREDDKGYVVASVGLLLAAPDTSPNEALVREVIGRAMSSIKSAVEEFGNELQKL